MLTGGRSVTIVIDRGIAIAIGIVRANDAAGIGMTEIGVMTATVKTEMIETVAEIGRTAVAGTVMKAPINARKTATKAPISARKIKIKMKAPRARKLATKV